MPVKQLTRRKLRQNATHWRTWFRGLIAFPGIWAVLAGLNLLAEVLGFSQTLNDAIPGGINAWYVLLGGIALALIAAFVQWIFHSDDAPPAVGLLNVQPVGLAQFSPDKSGEIRLDLVAGQPEIGSHLASHRGHPVSLAFAADGTVLATLAGQRLSFATVNPRTGTYQPWGTPIILDEIPSARVVAVAGKGDRDLWFILAVGEQDLAKPGTLRLGTYGNPKPVPLEGAPEFCTATHAAFIGIHAAYDIESVKRVFPQWARDPRLSGKRVIAVDAATVGGCTYLAVLAASSEPGAEGSTYEVMVIPRNGGALRVCEISSEHGTPANVRVIRSVRGGPEDVRVLVDTVPEPIRPFAAAGGDAGRPASARRQMPWNRTRKSAATAAAAAGRPS